MINLYKHTTNISKTLVNKQNNLNNKIFLSLLIKIKDGSNNLYDYIKAYELYILHIKRLNLNDEDLKIGFINLFFDRILWYNNYYWKPITSFSIELINFFGVNNEIHLNSFINYLNINLKRFTIIKNIFYIDKFNKKRKNIFYNILYIIHNYKRGGLSIPLSSQNKQGLERQIKSVNISHNFIKKKNKLPTGIVKKKDLKNIFQNIAKGIILPSNHYFFNHLTINSQLLKSNIEVALIEYLMREDKIYNSIHIVKITSHIHEILLFLEKLISDDKNVFYINDASGLKMIESYMSKSNNNNVQSIFTALNYLSIIYDDNLKNITLGMILDPALVKIELSRYQPIYNDAEYNNILLSFFYNFNELHGRLQFRFDRIISNEELLLLITDHSGIIHTFTFIIKEFNNIDIIYNVIQYIINLDETKQLNLDYIKNYFVGEKIIVLREYKKLINLLYKIFTNNYFISNTNIKKIFENYDTNKIVINKIINFILKFKLMGDQTQAQEANQFLTPILSMHSLKRVLVTQDRVLSSYCLIHENISFYSKMTIHQDLYFIWNYT